MKTISLSEKTTISIGKSPKFKTIQIELHRRKDDGTLKKAFLSLKSCRALFALQKEVKSIAAQLKLKRADDQRENQNGNVESGQDEGERAVELPLDDRRMLTVRKWHAGSPVSITVETLKEGEKQPGLAFHMDEPEWNSLQREAVTIKDAMDTVTSGLYAEKDDRIKMYRWLAITPDGSSITSVGQQWEYLEVDARRDAEQRIKAGDKLHLEYKLVLPPSKETVYSAVQIYLIRRCLANHRGKICTGCGPPAEQQANQLGHMSGGGYGCLDPMVEVVTEVYEAALKNLSPMEVAQLYHTVASTLKIATSTAATAAGSTTSPDNKMSPHQIKDIVLEVHSWEWIDLEELCRKVHLQDSQSLLPNRQ